MILSHSERCWMLLLLVDCQIGCACFSHFFFLFLFSSDLKQQIYIGQILSLSFFFFFFFFFFVSRRRWFSIENTSASKREKKITLDVVRAILSPSTVVLTSLLNSSIKMERANKKERETERMPLTNDYNIDNEQMNWTNSR